MFSLIKHKAPPQPRNVEFLCDQPISKRLEKYEAVNLCLNRSSTIIMVGPPGSGKTTVLNRILLITKKCFHTIFVFMKPHSRASMKDSPIKDLSHVYDDLDFETLQTVFGEVEANSNDDYRSLVIFDDVQHAYKSNRPLLALVSQLTANQRHLKCSIIHTVQNYIQLPSILREIANTYIMFKLSKKQAGRLLTEVFDMTQEEYLTLLEFYKNNGPHAHLMLHVPTQRIFTDQGDELVMRRRGGSDGVPIEVKGKKKNED